MMMDKAQEKEALKALLKALSEGDDEEEEEEAGDYVEERRESSVSPEEVEGELYDKKESITEDAEETLDEEEDEDEEDYEGEEKPMSLKDLVASFMEGEEDPFADKKGLRGGSLEIEVKKEGMMPAKALAKKAMAMKKAKKKMRGM